MLRKLILRQKFEKENFLYSTFIEREKLKAAKKWIDTSMIKVIVGPRRAGKSVFAFMLLKEHPFMYLNFDDEGFLSMSKIDTNEILKELHLAYGDVKTIFFDEIQNLENWQLFVNRLQREGYNLVITGSNANLLSTELSTALTGRHIPIEIMPFNFKEFLRAKKISMDEYTELPQKQAETLRLIDEFIIKGGYPEVVINEFDYKEYLRILFDSILLKDIVKRYNLRHSVDLIKLSSYLINNFSSLFTARKLRNSLSFKSITTVEKFISYIQEAYLIFTLFGYSFKSKERLRSPRKVYIVDNGFIEAKSVRISNDTGKLMENLVFTELIKEGLSPNQELFYYKTRNRREVDFIVKNGIKVKKIIQVSLWNDDEKLKERELKAIFEASEELSCDELIIITGDFEGELEYKKKVIKLIPLSKWLFNEKV